MLPVTYWPALLALGTVFSMLFLVYEMSRPSNTGHQEWKFWSAQAQALALSLGCEWNGIQLANFYGIWLKNKFQEKWNRFQMLVLNMLFWSYVDYYYFFFLKIHFQEKFHKQLIMQKQPLHNLGLDPCTLDILEVLEHTVDTKPYVHKGQISQQLCLPGIFYM